METTNTVEEKIILAAIECLEKFGVQGATNRKIAEIAGINSAAINYYFRSKEVLIQRAMERTLANAFDWKEIDQLPGDTPQEHCVAIFLNLIEGSLNYPGITHAHFFGLLTAQDYDALVVKRLNDFVNDLVRDLQQRGLQMQKEELQQACIQITSSVFFLILSPKLFLPGFDLDLSNSSQREKFIRSLVQHQLG
jgi:AcrR family transcriptional regulator